MIYIIISIIIAIIGIAIAFLIRYKTDIGIVEEIIKTLHSNKIKELEQNFERDIKHIETLHKEIREKKQKEIDDLLEHYKAEAVTYERNFINATMSYNERMNEIKEKRAQAEFDLKILEEKKEHTSEVLNTYYESEKARIDDKIERVLQSAIFEINSSLVEEEKHYKDEIDKLIAILGQYRAAQAAVNEAIMREKALQEQSEFYKINLSAQEIADLQLIQELAPRFNNRELLNKIVYESYIKRPLQEMIKRILNGRSPSGIYKITRQKTGEIYIGRAVAVDKRWTEHAKMAFSIGSIAHSTLHTLMEKDGIWNFTFELLEEVPKEQLNEREKYYVEFYDSKNFGMNQKAGG